MRLGKPFSNMRDKHIIELSRMFQINIIHYVRADLLSSPRSRAKSYVTMFNVMLLYRTSNKNVRKLAPLAAMQHFAIRCLAFISSLVTEANNSASHFTLVFQAMTATPANAISWVRSILIDRRMSCHVTRNALGDAQWTIWQTWFRAASNTFYFPKKKNKRNAHV